MLLQSNTLSLDISADAIKASFGTDERSDVIWNVAHQLLSTEPLPPHTHICCAGSLTPWLGQSSSALIVAAIEAENHDDQNRVLPFEFLDQEIIRLIVLIGTKSGYAVLNVSIAAAPINALQTSPEGLISVTACCEDEVDMDWVQALFTLAARASSGAFNGAQ